MNKFLISKILIAAGVVNTLVVIVAAIFSTNAYIIADSLKDSFVMLLCYIPLSLLTVAFAWWIFDLINNTENKVNHLAIAFSGIMVDAVFVIGSTFFATGP
jgi:hypothetical protein